MKTNSRSVLISSLFLRYQWQQDVWEGRAWLHQQHCLTIRHVILDLFQAVSETPILRGTSLRISQAAAASLSSNGSSNDVSLPTMVTNSMLTLPKVCMTVLMSLWGFDKFPSVLSLANSSTFVMVGLFRSRCDFLWDPVLLTLQSMQALFHCS